MCNREAGIAWMFGAPPQVGAQMAKKEALEAAGRFNKQMYDAQAAMNAARARRAEAAGAIAQSEAADRLRQTVATGRASYASNGLLLDGAPTDAPNLWEQDQAAMLAYEQAGILDAAGAEAWGFRSNAAVNFAQGKWAPMSARNQARAEGISSLSSEIANLGGMALGAIGAI